MASGSIAIVEVGPRDGFQPIGPFIPTDIKIALIRELHGAGVRRMEGAAFVSAKAVPQMADAAEILSACAALPDLDVQVLVPSERYAEQALVAGASHLAFVLSASDEHNRNNVRRSTDESLAEFARVASSLPAPVAVRLNLATAFDCPFAGAVETDRVIAIAEAAAGACDRAEIALCDTTGRATPDAVRRLFDALAVELPGRAWAFHGHDTYGLGVANALAAIEAGVGVVDASFGGLGGCPFAPGATGNVATEDLVWTVERMGYATGIAIDRLLDVSLKATALPGASSGGRVRTALRGRPATAQVLPA